ncbi:MAG: GIY-YIG nuclease family protein [Clostridia bacterium]|nr:GIY-YIG nuclease family protein [Clostridia bacterium]
MNNEWYVYKHTSPSGKVYIGITKDIRHRWRNNGAGYKGSTRIHNAILKYGWDNFKHEILFSGLSQKDACLKEIELIKHYQSTDIRYGYNLQSGGQNPVPSEESCKKISASLLGHSVSDQTKNKLSKAKSLPVICIESGVVYENASRAAEALGLCSTSIGKTTNGRQENCGGLHFAKLEDFLRGKLPIFKAKPTQYKKVRCVSTGQIFDNISSASKETGISRRAISYACNGKYKTSGGMVWEFVAEPEIA